MENRRVVTAKKALMRCAVGRANGKKFVALEVKTEDGQFVVPLVTREEYAEFLASLVRYGAEVWPDIKDLLRNH